MPISCLRILVFLASLLAPAIIRAGIGEDCREIELSGAAGFTSNDHVIIRIVDNSGGPEVISESCELTVEPNETAVHFLRRIPYQWGDGNGGNPVSNPTTCLTSCPDGVCPKKVCGNTAPTGRSCSVEARISIKKGKCLLGDNAGKGCESDADCPGGGTCPIGSPDGSIRSCDDVDADPFAPANEVCLKKPAVLRVCCRESALCKGSKLDATPAGIVPITIQTRVAPDPPLGSPEACLEPPVFCPPDVELPDDSVEPRQIALDPIGGRSGPYASQRVCRTALASATTTVAQTVLSTLRTCHRKVLRGDLPAGSCSTIDGTSDPSGSVATAVSTVQGTVTNSCQTSGHSPSDFGYRGCPAPCDGITVSTCTAGNVGPACQRDRDCDTSPGARDGRCGDWNALASCAACQAAAAGLAVTQVAYGNTGPGLSTDVQNCQNEIGEGVATLIGVELTDAAKCQRELDEFKRLLSSRTPKCKDADPKGKRAKARLAVAADLIASCSHTMLAQLDSCATNLAGLGDCIPRLVRRGTGAVLDAAAPEGRCGDGKRAFTEKCDDGNTVDGDGCDSNCTPTGCGNEVISTGEQCDDGNLAGGDGCDPTCQAEQQTCAPQMCSTYTFDCSTLFPGDCVCLQSAESGGLCVNNFDCNSAQPCSSSIDCSTPGERCYLQTCCGGPLPGRCGPPTCTGQPG